ncbi:MULTISPECIES: hypothetical protein [unclassified Gilliamella]|uniref:hypothetical protein n=1 Tax=unclassified Gilliamella TaxID=2685620 RepID=UPI0004618368|nr:hypothetical protein [Gilliamella apicola]KDN11305.1 TonB-dependent receptor [Gilliamella apicola]OCG53673.1 hypothetical protein A9G38_00475 [Gilliamella apicola]OCG63388.1 hypothetical protein A9G37_09215 [Gilliamella apicola]
MVKWKKLIWGLVCFAGICSTKSFCLSATTTNVIHGNAPRFIPLIEDKIENDKEFEYFGVNYKGIDYFNTTDLNAALGVDVASQTPSSLKLTVAIKQPSNTDVIDVDGDGDFTLTGHTSNSLSLDWYYEDTKNNEIKLTQAQKNLKFRELVISGIYPYIKVNGAISLNTKYGVPNLQSYPDNNIAITKIPYRNFNVMIGGEAIKYASPHMAYSGGIYTYGDTKIIDPTLYNGFLPQENYLNNFPSVGANNLYFYLVTDGIDNSLSTTKWTVKTSNADDESPNAITATIKKSIAPGTVGFKAYNAKNMVLVTLKGPDSSTKDASQATAPTAKLPVDIELIGETKQGVTLSYSFRITKWFINRGSFTAGHAEQQAWCEELGSYRQATARELSNAVITGASDNKHNDNYYKRAVHEGLITEWGAVRYFEGSHFDHITYGWTNTETVSNTNTSVFLYVNMNDAALHLPPNNDQQFYALCISK